MDHLMFKLLICIVTLGGACAIPVPASAQMT